MKSKIAYLTLFALMLVFAGSGLAQPRPDASPAPPNPGERMMQMLNLDETQQNQIAELRLKLQKELVPLRSELKGLEGELQLAVTADQFNRGKAETLVNKISNLRGKMQLARVLHQQEVRSLLNTEQRQKFDMHLLAGKGHGPHGGGKGHGPHGPHDAPPGPRHHQMRGQ